MRFNEIYKEGFLPKDIEWKDIKGLEGQYQVSNYGHVKRLFRINIDSKGRQHTYTEKIFYPKLIKNNDTYYTRISYGRYRDLTHRLVAKTFIPNPNNLPEVNHIDGHKKFYSYAGTRQNNYKDGNLEWCNRKLNMEHASKTGLLNRDSEKRKRAVRRNQLIATEKNKKEVLMYDTKMSFLAKFISVKTAGQLLDIPPQNISRACRINGYSAGGFLWKYK